MGNSWSYVPNDHYKSSTELIHLLLKIVSRGGNLLLNIGPSPEGDFADTAYARLKDIGAWMKVHSNGIYGTTVLPPYEESNIIYLQSKDSSRKYIYLLSDGKNEMVTLPPVVHLNNYIIAKGNKIRLVDLPGEKISYKTSGSGTDIFINKKWVNKEAGKYAIAFEISK